MLDHGVHVYITLPAFHTVFQRVTAPLYSLIGSAWELLLLHILASSRPSQVYILASIIVTSIFFISLIIDEIQYYFIYLLAIGIFL